LRALIRQARKDARETRPGEAPRRGHAYREIFAIVRARLERV
jgi:ribosome-associated protein